MAPLPQIRSKTAQAIDQFYVENQERTDDLTLRCSSMGKACDRRLWYAFRWAHQKEVFTGRALRIFENGKIRESVIVSMLRGAGIDVREIDEATGAQCRIILAGGLLTGSCDGIAENVPEALKTPHLVEIKTMNAKRWENWRRKGVASSDPEYFVQCQLYMHGLSLTRCLFVAENKDTQEIEVERLHYDPVTAEKQIARAERIASSDKAPPRLSDDPGWYECRFCPAYNICHAGAPARRNCRTCLAGEVSAQGEWGCARYGRKMTPGGQLAGCDTHLYLPALVAGEQVDADKSGMTVTYKMRDGSTFVDGGVPCIRV
jgi:hypothetical protein